MLMSVAVRGNWAHGGFIEGEHMEVTDKLLAAVVGDLKTLPLKAILFSCARIALRVRPLLNEGNDSLDVREIVRAMNVAGDRTDATCSVPRDVNAFMLVAHDGRADDAYEVIHNLRGITDILSGVVTHYDEDADARGNHIGVWLEELVEHAFYAMPDPGKLLRWAIQDDAMRLRSLGLGKSPNVGVPVKVDWRLWKNDIAPHWWPAT